MCFLSSQGLKTSKQLLTSHTSNASCKQLFRRLGRRQKGLNEHEFKPAVLRKICRVVKKKKKKIDILRFRRDKTSFVALQGQGYEMVYGSLTLTFSVRDFCS